MSRKSYCMQSYNCRFASPAFRSVPMASQADKHGSGGRSRLIQDPTQDYYPRTGSGVTKAPKGRPAAPRCWGCWAGSTKCLPQPKAGLRALHPCELAGGAAFTKLLHLQSCSDILEGNYSYDINCHFNRLLITTLLLMFATVMLRCIIVLSTVLTQGKVIPCTLIVFHELWCIFL